MAPESIYKNIILPVPGELKPLIVKSPEGNSYTDHSRWLFFPEKKMPGGKKFKIIFKPGLMSKSGIPIEKKKELSFTTARRPQIIASSPEPGKKNVNLFQEIKLHANEKLSSADIKLVSFQGSIVEGTSTVRENTAVFRPVKTLVPGTSYTVHARVTSIIGEKSLPYNFNFKVRDMEDKLWVEVSLGKIHTLTVYKGRFPIRHMLASGGLEDSKTITGTFYTRDRGESFWSARFGEGACYWVRLHEQYLIHGVPRGAGWKTKKEEHAKLGLPASHGCVRLADPDALWFYKNIPQNTMVIIHL